MCGAYDGLTDRAHPKQTRHGRRSAGFGLIVLGTLEHRTVRLNREGFRRG
jgi:hypothetical protein